MLLFDYNSRLRYLGFDRALLSSLNVSFLLFSFFQVRNKKRFAENKMGNTLNCFIVCITTTK